MRVQTTVADIEHEFKKNGTILSVSGPGSTVITTIAAVANAGPGALVFADKADYLEPIRSRRPAAVVTSVKLEPLFSALPGLCVLTAHNVALAHALIKARYAARDFTASAWLGVHASAVVDPSARLGESVVIEPLAVVGRCVQIGQRTRIMAGAVIEHDAVIGDDCVIHPRAVIGYRCQIGHQAVIGAGAVVGSEGYGFAQDAQRKSHPIPQTGIVVIEDRVRIGASCCIDRATYEETRIGAGTKIDNLCHIAHNVQIGEDCLLTAMLCVAGSTKIGNRVIASGQTGLLDHVKVCDDVVLLHRAGVSKDIDSPGVYAGMPTQPLAEYLKQAAAQRTAPEMRKRLMRIESRMAGTHEDNQAKPDASLD